MTKVFIDGSAGTTGLRIYDRLAKRKDISLMTLSEEHRKDINYRKEALNSSDISFLCLPDAAAVEAVSLIENENTVVIDTSTAHRTNPEWAYGFPELSGLREEIKNSKRIANPGCHASGFIALIRPLVEHGIISADCELSAFSVTGYSGGGKKMIAEYEADELDELLTAPRMYGLSQMHKHLPEMVKTAMINTSPVFCPIVSDFYSGMEVTVPIFASQINGSVDDIKKIYSEYYSTEIVRYCGSADENGFLSAAALSGKDSMQLSVFGNDGRVTLCARYDNLGKGASGAAIQNMNIVLGVDETTGLSL